VSLASLEYGLRSEWFTADIYGWLFVKKSLCQIFGFNNIVGYLSSYVNELLGVKKPSANH